MRTNALSDEPNRMKTYFATGAGFQKPLKILCRDVLWALFSGLRQLSTTLALNSSMWLMGRDAAITAIAAAGASNGTVSAGSKKVGDVPQVHKDLCREVAKYFKGEISVKRRPNGKGTLTINFSSDSEIGGFLDALKK